MEPEPAATDRNSLYGGPGPASSRIVTPCPVLWRRRGRQQLAGQPIPRGAAPHYLLDGPGAR
jgi:hypothetical protein